VADNLHWAAFAAHDALLATTAAACVIPAAWPVAGVMYGLQCDPGAMIEAGRNWSDMAGEFGKCSDELARLVNELTSDAWTGQDRDAFDARIADYNRQFTGAQVLAVAMATALIVIGLLLIVLILLMVAIGVVLGLFAAAILACLAGVVSAPAAAEIFVEGDAIALEAAEMLESCGTIIQTSSSIAAGVITAAMAGDVTIAAFNGDDHLTHDLLQSVLDSGDTVFWGTLAKAEQDFTGHGIATGNSGFVAAGVSDSSPHKLAVPTLTSTLQNYFDPPDAHRDK
jgi:hypothetical protein